MPFSVTPFVAALRNKLESIFEHVYLSNAMGVLSSRTRRGGKRKRLIESKIEFSFPPTNKSVQIQAKLSLRVPGWKQNPIFVSSPRNRCARRNQSCCSKQVVVPFPFFFYLFLVSFERFHSEGFHLGSQGASSQAMRRHDHRAAIVG